MTESGPAHHYSLGSTDAEHERLICQASRLAPLTERLFREAGIGQGQRVLDLGSGVGDVAILVARLVGPSGEVVGAERDTHSIARARARVAEAGLRNVSFTQSDVNQIVDDKPFDPAVGRFILEFLPDPLAALRSVSRLVRPGGVLAFHEPCYAPFLLLSAHLPLWSASVSLIHQTLLRSGANTEIGLELHRIFLEAGLPGPTCAWTYCLVAIQTLRGGPTIFSVVCVHKSNSRIFPSNCLVTLLRFLKDFKPRLQHRRPSSLLLPSSEPGPTSRSTKFPSDSRQT